MFRPRALHPPGPADRTVPAETPRPQAPPPLARPRRPGPADLLAGAVIAAFAVAEELTGRSPGSPVPAAWWAAAGLAAGLLITVRGRAPFPATAALAGFSVCAFLLAGRPPAAWQWCAQLVLLFTLLTAERLRSARAVLGGTATAGVLLCMLAAAEAGPGDMTAGLVMAAVAGGAGAVVRRRRPAEAAEERRALAAARSELLAREAVAEERARIARELHDLVAHSVSVMVMQAGGVRLMLKPGRERELVEAIERTGRETVEELRRMLGLLRGPEPDRLVPQPNLDRLGDLLDQVRAAGLEVTLEVDGEPGPLPAGLELSAYRIVQEALTNVLKHTGPTRVTVRLAHRPHELRLEITDAGPRPGHTAPGSRAGGRGLIGLRERVALFQGTLITGPTPGGGYGVRAVLPLGHRRGGEPPADPAERR